MPCLVYAWRRLGMSLAIIRDVLGTQCTRCPLHQHRTQVVFGDGPEDAKILIVGEAPGADEDASGKPFVGASGRRLNLWLGILGIPREKVYISNVCKCRPWDHVKNRKPFPDEIAACSPFLEQEIAAIKPRLLLALGGTPAVFLSGQNKSLKDLRPKELWYERAGLRIPLGVTYHPSYEIQYDRDGSIRKMVIEDLTRAIRRTAEPSPQE